MGVERRPFEAVLEAAKSGVDGAVADIYRDLYPRLLRYLRTREPGEAEDLASQTWIDIATGLHGFHGDEVALRAWAFTIARRRLIDHRRRTHRRPSFSTPMERLEELGPLGDAEEEAMAAVATSRALEYIASLPRDQAEVVLLRVVAGLGVAEVAMILGKRRGTIRVIQHRALRRLAGIVEREDVTR